MSDDKKNKDDEILELPGDLDFETIPLDGKPLEEMPILEEDRILSKEIKMKKNDKDDLGSLPSTLNMQELDSTEKHIDTSSSITSFKNKSIALNPKLTLFLSFFSILLSIFALYLASLNKHDAPKGLQFSEQHQNIILQNETQIKELRTRIDQLDEKLRNFSNEFTTLNTKFEELDKKGVKTQSQKNLAVKALPQKPLKKPAKKK